MELGENRFIYPEISKSLGDSGLWKLERKLCIYLIDYGFNDFGLNKALDQLKARSKMDLQNYLLVSFQFIVSIHGS
jgi:hypothetical protein